MQLTGDRFTTSSALFGNDLSTFPDFPAEIRAPAGTLAGVSAFQVHISDHDILTPGDAPNVLVAMNPAALRANIGLLPKGAILLVNIDAFDERNLTKAGYASNPLTDGSLGGLHRLRGPDDLHHPGGLQGGRGQAPRRRAVQELLRPRPGQLALHPADRAHARVDHQALRDPPPGGRGQHPGLPGRLRLRRDGRAVRVQLRGAAGHLRAGRVRPDHRQPGPGLGPDRGRPGWPGCPLFLGSYPITPASDILHELSPAQGVRGPHLPGRGRDRRRRRRPRGGLRRVARGHHHQRPGLDLKSETIGLAVNLELPLLVVDVQRGGPSTGLPTKTEQADLLHAMYGRHGEAPVPIVAARTPAHCFEAAIEAVRLAVKYRTPVILLSDGYLANGAEPWQLPDVDALPAIEPGLRHRAQPRRRGRHPAFWPYVRDPETLARPWAAPGHARARAPHRRPREGRRQRATSPTTRSTTSGWSSLRAAKIAGIAKDIPPSRSTTRTATPRCWCSAGAPPTAPSRPASPGPGPGPEGRPRPPAPPEPVPGQPGRGAAAATARCWSPR